MARSDLLITALTDAPASTSELYDRIGYPTLARVGLIPYPAFRSELEKLASAGLATSEAAPDGSTVWRLVSSGQ